MVCIVNLKFFGILILSSVVESISGSNSIPDNVLAKSELLYNSFDKLELFEVEEVVDKSSGSIHIKMFDSSKDLASKNKLTSYYRLNQAKATSADDLTIAYSYSELICKIVETKDWQINQFTLILKRLIESAGLESDSIKQDRSAIGPVSLLKLFYANQKLFKLTSKAFDEVRLVEMYYFEAKVDLTNSKQSARLICLLPTSDVSDENLPYESASLSEINMTTHPPLIAVIIHDKDDLIHANTEPFKLINSNDLDLEKLLISYVSIQEFSLNKHLGLKLDRIDGLEQNPFTLPAGVGCGTSITWPADKTNSIFLDGRQFSGLYAAEDLEGMRFLAFDGESNTLRVDLLSEYKMIIDLRGKTMTFMEDSNSQRNQPMTGRRTDEHCSSMSFVRKDFNKHEKDTELEMLLGTKDFADILGFDKYLGLSYLGTKFLEDGTHCLVLERELSYDNIPLIFKLNILSKLGNTGRFFMVLYLVDEFLEDSLDFENYSIESTWIKRMELVSLNAALGRQIVNSRLTFDEFSWSLEALADDTRDYSSKLLHPVRAFDLIECSQSGHSLIELELLIKQLNSTRNEASESQSSRELDLDSFFQNHDEAFMSFLSRQTRISRPYINELDTISSDDGNYMMVTAKLTEPLDYEFESDLIGWIQSLDSIPFEKHGSFLKQSANMLRYECLLRLAVLYNEGRKIFMVYCPNIGCGFIENDSLNSLDYTRKDKPADQKPGIANSLDMCEIHLVRKSLVPTNLEKYSLEKLQKSFKSALVAADLMGQDQNFRGIVVKSSAEKSSQSHSNLGHLIKKNSCYTSKTRIDDGFKVYDPSISVQQIQVLELALDQHHSLFYCQRACQMATTHCVTYSYEKSTRTCVLSNITETMLLSDSFQILDLKFAMDCKIYQANSLELYTSIPETRAVTLEGLTFNNHTRYYLDRLSLSECAKLCHANELYCDGFKYFKLDSICMLDDDEGRNLVRKLMKSNYSTNAQQVKSYFRELVGASEWSTLHHYHIYKRTYSQYYAIGESTKIELDSKESKEENDGRLGNNLQAKYPVLYGLDLEDCLRECTLIRKECVMIDHCFYPINEIPTKSCHLFAFRSPELIEGPKAKDIPGITDVEKSLYVDSQNVRSTINLGCNNYYMAGDNLILKRIIAKKFSPDESSLIDKLERQDQAKSDGLLAILMGLDPKSKVGGLQPLLSIVIIFVGSLFGSVSTIYLPKLDQRYQFRSKIVDYYNSINWRRRERSQSRLELANMITVQN